jgi:hypothetical protein
MLRSQENDGAMGAHCQWHPPQCDEYVIASSPNGNGLTSRPDHAFHKATYNPYATRRPHNPAVNKAGAGGHPPPTG